jgi:hypothetical protein
MLQPHTTEPTYAERMEAAYQAGCAAKRSGLPISRCPHQRGTPAWAEWTVGWNAIEIVQAATGAAS